MAGRREASIFFVNNLENQNQNVKKEKDLFLPKEILQS